MKWRSAAVTVAWAAVATVAGALGAWTLAGFDGAPGDRSRPLDDAAVRRALASSPHPPTAPTTPAPRPTDASPTRTTGPAADPSEGTTDPPRPATLRFTGGTATAECRPDGSVYLISWSPADGYHVEEYARGPAAVARIELEPALDDADDLTYEIHCGPAGEPDVRRAPEDDD